MILKSKDIQDYRKSLGLTQRDMSILLGLGVEQIGRYERGLKPNLSVQLLIIASQRVEVLKDFLKFQRRNMSEEGVKAVEGYIGELES